MGGGVESRRVGRVCGADVTARLSHAVTSAANLGLVLLMMDANAGNM
jgi:hypothetical protein